jgi:uncharacterized protein (DUF58 family)
MKGFTKPSTDMVDKKNEISADIVHRIKKLEIITRRLLNGSLVGDSRSAIKGTGFEFDQLRDYNFGDDVRSIDWKSSARTNKMLIKQYIEERNRTIYLMVDISLSNMFGSHHFSKSNRMAEIACILALVAQHGKDSVGLILFADDVHHYIPPGNSLTHIHMIMRTVLSSEAQGKTTDISKALSYILKRAKKDAIIFLLSDFIDQTFDVHLPVMGRKYDFIAVRCLDTNEKHIPAIGFITINDLETGELFELDMRPGSASMTHAFLESRIAAQNAIFRKNRIDCFDVMAHNDNYIIDLVKFFRRRMMY